MKWSILILTQPSRTEFLARLLEVLNVQLRDFPDIELLIFQFDKSLDLGANRQRLIDAANGEYICFVDDDDLLADDYVQSIHPLLDGMVDYVGFELQLYTDGAKADRKTFHSLKYGGWYDDHLGWYRDISHLNPIRREYALKVKMSGGRGEDRKWSDELRETGLIKTEHYIPAVMYHYYFRTGKSD